MLVATEHGPALIDDRDIELFWSAVSADTSRLDEDQVIAAIEELQRGGSADLRIQYAGKTVALRPIVAAEVATRFGFIAHPRSTDPSPCP
jgi:hypothetical protein